MALELFSNTGNLNAINGEYFMENIGELNQGQLLFRK